MTLNVTHLPRVALPVIKLGDRVRIVRRDEKKNISQEDFAAGLSEYLDRPISGKAIASWEAGRSEPHNKDEVCVALERYTGYPRAWFMGWLDPDGTVTRLYQRHKPHNWGRKTPRTGRTVTPTIGAGSGVHPVAA